MVRTILKMINYSISLQGQTYETLQGKQGAKNASAGRVGDCTVSGRSSATEKHQRKERISYRFREGERCAEPGFVEQYLETSRLEIMGLWERL